MLTPLTPPLPTTVLDLLTICPIFFSDPQYVYMYMYPDIVI